MSDTGLIKGRAAAWLGIGVALGLAAAAGLFWMVASASRGAGESADLPESTARFIRSVDLSPLDRAAVHSEGRLKSFDSFAHETMRFISGPRRALGLPADAAYLELMLRPGRYADADIIYVKNKPMRAQIRAALNEGEAAPRERLDQFLETGLLSPELIRNPAVVGLMVRWSADVVRTAKLVETLQGAMGISRPEALLAQLDMIPPPDGRESSPWIGPAEFWSTEPTAVRAEGSRLDGLAPELRAGMEEKWRAFALAWRAEDAAAAGAALSGFCSLLPRAAPGLYPSPQRLELESWYFKAGNLTWVWLIYFMSVILLLMAVAYRWERARLMGAGIFGVAFALHTLALLWRWYVSGRWPNSNMFEAVTTSVWLGTVAALGLEALARRTPLRNLFMLGGAAASMCALMAAHFVPELTPSINNIMPVLHDVWLYIHTNVIITSYAVIAMASVTALLYLAYRLGGGSREYARAGGAGMLIAGDGEMGAGPIPAPGSGHAGRIPMGVVLDGATMVLMELSFVLLWTGLVMGAIWADHSWGRPWGWDPKEVFALNTFLVFLVLVHVRLKARDKGLWTAVLAVAGCGVMLFNWIVINFVISGLHSYA